MPESAAYITDEGMVDSNGVLTPWGIRIVGWEMTVDDSTDPLTRLAPPTEADGAALTWPRPNEAQAGVRHCSDGERLGKGKFYCGPDCKDRDA